MREVIQCLIDWLRDNPSEAKAHRILCALAHESLKKADSVEEKRRFDSMDIAAAANENKKNNSDANDWIDWKRTVLRYWESRENLIIDTAKKRGLKFYPKPDRISTQGGPDLTTYLIKAEPLPEISDEAEAEPFQEQLGRVVARQQTAIHYEIAEDGEVKPAWGTKWLLQDGQIRLSIRHISAVIGFLVMLWGGAIMFSYFSWAILSAPKPITTRELIIFLSIFVVPYAIWGFVIKPWMRLFEDRIVRAPELLVDVNEKPSQLELFRDGDLRLIRLVRYFAPCPICGATIYLDEGSPDYPRRMVGRCSESPREHIFSFDRVTRKGIILRGPIV
jgi:hypothetical protein